MMVKKFFDPKNIIAVDVYLEFRKTRKFAGILRKEKSSFYFEYDMNYLRSDSSIPIGTDLPLTEIKHTSKILFKSFEDRIPSKHNPAYKDYCMQMGIEISEKNPIILLATIGHKGPSSFIFEPRYCSPIKINELQKFRKKLGLTFREFADVFDFSTRTLQSFEADKPISKETIKRLEIYALFPRVALYEVMRSGSVLTSEKKHQVIKCINEMEAQSQT